MSEEKMYVVKNDDCEWADSKHIFGHGAWATPDKTKFEQDAKHYGGHVVILIEEPEKVVLTKAQAEIVEEAHIDVYPATYIADHTSVYDKDENLLMNAYVNGYTVGKEKKYIVYKRLGGKHKANVQYAQAYRDSAHSKIFSWIITSWLLSNKTANGSFVQFTEAEIEYYGLQDCEKEEVTDDEQ